MASTRPGDRANQGDPRIVVAVLDGAVDLSHPCFKTARLRVLDPATGGPGAEGGPNALGHGTHVASMIFGRGGGVAGVAPDCSGLIIPIFGRPGTEGLGCSQLDLARAILIAVENGAHLINVSGGQLDDGAEPDALLAQAIATCARENVLIVAAAGNDGCACAHLPAAAPSVLAVGALGRDGWPLPASNFGDAYRHQGVLAPGQDMPGAVPGGGVGARTGTSFATPIVTGLAALLLSRQVATGGAPDPGAVRRALLAGADPCPPDETDCRRFLTGRVDPVRALTLLNTGVTTMSDLTLSLSTEDPDGYAARPATGWEADGAEADGVDADGPAPSAPVAAAQNVAPAEAVTASDCGCGGGDGAPKKPQLVYALGKIGFDFGTEARRDSFRQAMPAGANPHNAADLLSYLDDAPYEASMVIWTLNLDATPIYAILPAGTYAETGFARLREFLEAQIHEGAELVSIPGTLGGKVRLQSGQIVPVIVPALRGLYSWSTGPLVTHILGEAPEDPEARAAHVAQAAGLTDFLNRIYFDLRNLGVSSAERALNFAATNALQAASVIRSTTEQGLDLDTIAVRKSPICRPDSDCHDVELSFFNPDNLQVAKRIFRFTVDVSDVIPVTIGEVRSWTRRR